MATAWFARSRTAHGTGRSVRPISWQGWAVLVGFIGSMSGGGMAFLAIVLLTERFFPGILAFVTLATAGAGTFLWAVVTKSVDTPSGGSSQAAKPER